MEPLSAVELFNKMTESNVKFSTYTGDDDSTTECHLKQNVPYGVEKWSDTVHTKRSLTTRLYNLSQRGKFPNSSVLSQKVINYLVKCFTYCVAQNKGDAANMKIAIQSIVPHAFGNHTGCRETWCRHKKDPSNYNHRDLPYGKDLEGDSLQSALKSLFGEYSTGIVISKLAPAANSQRNECLNSVVGTKNPKIRYYGGSESSDYRVSCGVAQANVGYKYILEALNMEPGFFCEVHSLKMEKKSSMDKERKSTLPFKIRRWQLNKQKISETSKKEAKEGSMYESGIGLNLDTSETARQSNTSELSITEFYCTAITKEQQVQYENVVPKYTPRPTINKEKFDDSKCYNFYNFTDSKQALFSPRCRRLALSDELLVNRSSVISVKDAAEDMKWLDNRHQRLLTLRGKLYNPGSAGSPIKQTIAEKISGSGLGYEDLKNVFQQFGRKGLVCILTRPPLSCHSPSRPRVTNTMRIVSAIVRYFEQNFTDSAT
ncbi:hypothetical protein ACROYT_G038486 [Oculina patagonica]